MARGLSIKGYNPKGFLDILDGQWWTIDRHLTLEQTKYSAVETLISCIRNGVTTVFDHHASFGQIGGSLFTIADVAKELGVKGFRKLKLSRETYVIGQQGQYLDENSAIVLLNKITRYGFQIEQYKTCFELYEKGLLDSLTIVRA